MRKVSTILFLCLISLSSFGQAKSKNASITWGQQFDIGRKYDFSDIITMDDKGAHLLFYEYKGLFSAGVYHIANIGLPTPNFKAGKPIVFKSGANDLYLYDLVESGENVYFFSSHDDRKAKYKTFYMHEYNKSKQTISQGKEIGGYSYDGFKRRHSGNFDVLYSEDRKVNLVYYNLPFEKEEPEKFGAIAYDENMSQIWKKEFTLPYNDELFSIDKVFVGNNAELFFIGRKFKEKKKRRDPKYFDYVLLASQNLGEDLMEYSIKLKDYYIADLTAEMNEKNDIVISGFTSTFQRSTSFKGVFYMVIDDKTKEIEIESTKEFDFDFFTEGMSEKQEKKASKKVAKGKELEFPEFKFREMVMKQNGGVVVTAEQYYVVVVTTTDPKTGATRTTYYYHYNDIIVIDINKDGEINWATKIPKRQVSTNDYGYYSSYVIGVKEDKIYLFYLDHIDNLNNRTLRQKNYAGGKAKRILTNITIGPDGKYDKEMMFTIKESIQIPIAKKSMQMTEDEILLYAALKGKHKFGIIKLK